MPTIPEAEARILLGRGLKCEDAPDWRLGTKPEVLQIQSGLTDERGVKTDLFVDLSMRRDVLTGDVRYIFSVFRMNTYGLDRVYQLCVRLASNPIKNAHGRSHEHVGSLRRAASAGWQKWAYDEILAYFCTQTKIVFVPAPPDPLHNRKGWNCHEQPCRYVWYQLPGL
jgi:hypothetical protein